LNLAAFSILVAGIKCAFWKPDKDFPLRITSPEGAKIILNAADKKHFNEIRRHQIMWYLTEERRLMQNIVREFTEKEVVPFIPEMENDKYPRHLLKRMGELGILGLCFPPEVGGTGPDWVGLGMAVEEVARESNTMALLLMLSSSICGNTLFHTGTKEQIEKWVKPTIAGDMNFAFALTEPAGIFNWTEHQTRAVLDGDVWVVNGGKIFCTNAGQADYYIVSAQTSKPNPATLEGCSYIVVPRDTPGFEVGHIENKLGWRGSSTGQIYFRNCRVPGENLLGPQDKIIPVIMSSFAEFAVLGAMCLGSAVGVFEKTRKYVKERIQQGKSLFENYQMVRASLSQMWAEIEMFRGGLYQTLEMMDRGMNAAPYAVAVKIQGAMLFESVASRCVELHGGNGTVFENDIERYYRDAKMCHVGGGATPVLVDLLSNFI
jgi:alkylation response protein AidB-like acyl-CoA dehydrogenase